MKQAVKQKCQPTVKAMKTKTKIDNQGYNTRMQTIQNQTKSSKEALSLKANYYNW